MTKQVSTKQVIELVEAYSEDGFISLENLGNIIDEFMTLHIILEYGSVEAYEEYIGKTYDFADVMEFINSLGDEENL